MMAFVYLAILFGFIMSGIDSRYYVILSYKAFWKVNKTCN